MNTDQNFLAACAATVAAAYQLKAPDDLGAHENPLNQFRVCAQVENSSGLKAMAYWDAVNKQLLFAIAGTDPFPSTEFFEDLDDDVALAILGDNAQLMAAKDWVSSLIASLEAAGTAPASVIFAGHSLGGFIAQNLANLFGIGRAAEAILFNAPGIDPGLSDLGAATFAGSTIVYSDPRTGRGWTRRSTRWARSIPRNCSSPGAAPAPDMASRISRRR